MSLIFAGLKHMTAPSPDLNKKPKAESIPPQQLQLPQSTGNTVDSVEINEPFFKAPKNEGHHPWAKDDEGNVLTSPEQHPSEGHSFADDGNGNTPEDPHFQAE